MSTSTKRASNDLLDELHGLQASVLLEELRAYKAGERKVIDKDGVAHALGVPPALLAQINKYLKDNGVDRAIVPGDPTDLLADEVPDFEDNVVSFGANHVHR